MAFFNGLLGNASKAGVEDKLLGEIEEMIYDSEEVLGVYKLIRDLVVITDARIIVVDKQGVTGKKKEYKSIPYKSVKFYSVETAGYLDFDSELKIYCSGDPASEPTLSINFTFGTDVVEMQKILGEEICC